MFYHSITKFLKFVFSSGKRSAIFLSRTWFQSCMSRILFQCSKTSLDGTTHEQTITCRQIFAGHVVGSRPIERKGQNASNDNNILPTERGAVLGNTGPRSWQDGPSEARSVQKRPIANIPQHGPS